ncbi:hypothetical protein ACK8OR_10760 [Jannaschia sp. KMU-145]|uniref:hypothetical protein n=1 Tax=Jannaschia halovivens TaxID=3388667 RepID=UPI00396B0985
MPATTLPTIYFGLILLTMVGMNVVVALLGALDARATLQDTPRPAPERSSAATLVLSQSNLVGAHRFDRTQLAG